MKRIIAFIAPISMLIGFIVLCNVCRAIKKNKSIQYEHDKCFNGQLTVIYSV